MKATKSIRDCTHTRTERRIATFTNGTLHHRLQCLDCGLAIGNQLKNDGKSYPAFDRELRESGQDLLWAGKREERAAFQRWYSAYLESPEWKQKRRMVLDRDGWACRGCLVAKAEVVHHTTYAHVGDELLFELVSLCRKCHDRAHADKED